MSSETEDNPFVGPRPIGPKEPLYGRDHEVRGLYDRLLARRIVVLHSPSGAGKSSLVQAGLMPRLRKGGFDVWRPIRVNLDPLALPGVPEGTNRYVLSAMLSLEEELPAERRRGPAEVARLGLLDYVDGRPRRRRRAHEPVVLIFDQFEEVLTRDSRDVAAKHAFFDMVGRVLDTKRYWALFIIREDHLPALAPYRDRIPTQLTNTFRLDLLGTQGAAEAATRLAAEGGRAFPAAAKLVEDLSMVQVQQLDGSMAVEPGLYVEPVHLQVVGRRLWETLPPEVTSIEHEHVERLADVSGALASYYADTVAAVSGGDLAVERALREWVEHQLIVGGARSQVRQEPGQSAGLDNEWIAGLLGRYLVRSEQRAGATWFELGHDRLVEPIVLDNEQWEEEHLHPVQVQAKLWEQGRRSPALLLTAEALPGATAWAEDNEGLLVDSERDLLERSTEVRAGEARLRRRKTAALFAMAVVVVVIAAMGAWARSESEQAKMAERKAHRSARTVRQAREEARHSSTKVRRAHFEAREALLLAGAREQLSEHRGEYAALLLLEAEAPGRRPGWVGAANAVLAREHPSATLAHDDVVRTAEWSPDGSRILTATATHATVWSADGSGAARVRAGHRAELVSARWSPDGTRVLTASRDGTARISRASGEGEGVLLGGGAPLDSAEWYPDGRGVVMVTVEGTVRPWALHGTAMPASAASRGPQGATGRRVELPRVARAGLHAPPRWVAWSPDGRRAVVTSSDGSIRVWSAAPPNAAPVVLHGHDRGVFAAFFGPHGRRVVSLSHDSDPQVHWADGVGLGVPLGGHEGPVGLVRWSPDGRRLLTVARAGRTVRTWDVGDAPWLTELHHGSPVRTVAWSPDGAWLVTTGDDRVRVWRTAATADGDSPIERDLSLMHAGADNDVPRVAPLESWNPTRSHRIVSNGRTASIVAADDRTNRFGLGPPRGAAITHVGWSPDGARVLTAFADGVVRLQRIEPSVPVLRRALRTLTSDCLPVELLHVSLGFPRDHAHALVRRCERRRGLRGAPRGDD